MYTECPNCNTVFRVTPEQLKVAAGKVRCGNCNAVFNSLETLSNTLPENAPDGGAEVSEPPEDEFSMGTDDDFFQQTEEPSSSENQEDFENPSNDLDTLEDLFAENEGEIAKELELDEMDESLTESEERQDAFDDEERLDDLDSLFNEEDSRLGTGGDEDEILKDLDADDYVLEELSSGEPQERSYKGAMRAVWTVLVLVLVVGLAGQVVYFQRAELAKYPAVQPWLERMCGVLSQYVPCDVPPPRDLSAIRLMERDVRSDPETPNTLVIKATMVNEASFDQPYPRMRLRFSDINQNLVAERNFAPSEYLTEGVDAEGGMKKDLPVRVALKILDPGKEAVNFEFIFE